MFEPQALPRVFAVPPGEDFSAAFVQGLLARQAGGDPFDAARVQVLVNTRRSGKRITEMLIDGGARLLPRITPISDLASAMALPDSELPTPDLRRRLQLNRIVLALLDRQPDLAPRAAAFDLAETLARLIDEMHEEGVAPEALLGRDFGDLSQHWQRSLEVLSIVARYFGPGSEAAMTPAARLAEAVIRLAADWRAHPPAHPVIVAGSTGSRGTTFRLMQAVARLPQGALVLPGYDFAQPEVVWQQILDTRAEEHPQYRFARLRQALGLDGADVRPWTAARGGARNALISLSLRPAPVSDQWIVEGPALGDLTAATAGMALVEAPDARTEALAIATALRRAVAEGRSATVVTPDRNLTRQVAAELGRWHIAADDSAGEPLAQTPRGRLLRHAAEALVEPPRVETLLVILKHPLTHAGGGRARHLRWTRELELRLRRDGRPRPGSGDLARLIEKDGKGRGDWAAWIADTLVDAPRAPRRALADHLRHHVALAEALVAGSAPEGEGPLWTGAEGVEARRVMAGLEREADHGGELTTEEYRDLVTALLVGGEVRQTAEAHPLVRFRGTLEARVQGADLVILAGLNEAMWPAHAAPDPWMNRRMRREVGLTLPERRIGLSAHDYQQAVTTPQVILTRQVRDASAQTVPSRWLGRLIGLLDGLPDTGAPALAAMRARGAALIALAEALDRPPRGWPRRHARRRARRWRCGRSS